MSDNTILKARSVLKHYWGYEQFRPLQEDIVLSVMAENDTLALLPTGGGKSICFQVPALMREGICLVISPLIALMKDQVDQLKRRNISARAIYSGMSKREIDILLDNCIYGHEKFLYVSPERLKTEIFIERAKQMNICLLAVDEAHCISQWGYDFRPPYLEIAAFREIIGKVPCIALTASATPVVKNDICDKLHFERPAIFQKSFARSNLSYSAFNTEKKENRLIEILQKVPGSSVVYVRNRKKTRLMADFLKQKGLSADYYHAGLSTAQRDSRQQAWIKGQTRIIVSTNAFGMGIDKPDVRTVVHLDLPPDLESYYQEAGRAGRDEKMAYAVLLFNKADIEHLQEQIQLNYPAVAEIKKVYNALCNHFKIAVGSGEMASYDFDYDDFVRKYSLSPLATFYSLKQLEHFGFVFLNEGLKQPSKLLFQANAHDVYAFQVANAHFDAIIKLLLRAYGGSLYTDFITISEAAIAQHLKVSEQQVLALLSELHEMKIAVYEPKKEKPQVTFLQGRIATDRLQIDRKWLEERKTHDWNKAKAVIEFAQHVEKCRTRMILDYFGEWTEKNCGVCDFCLKEKKAMLNVPNTMAQKISALVKLKSLSMEELLDSFKGSQRQEVEDELRSMLDYGIIRLGKDGKIHA